MAKRVVGKGRGSVFAGGKVYEEGATIPDDVQVGDHVFEDSDEVEGNVAATVALPVVGPGGDEEPATPASGNVDEVLARVGDDPSAAAEALIAEQGSKKPRKSLMEKLQAIVDGSSSSS